MSKYTKFASLLIYGGTLCLSVLSFFTTFYGLKIILEPPLALVGSLGLQIAMLGIAWNLMKIRENRISYVAVFTITAVFSIFFSFANFDSSLKVDLRETEARKNYSEAVRPLLNEYIQKGRQASLKGDYQVERLNTLMQMEEEKGWATVVDEGTQDEFIQSVIDGARLMIDSWRASQGTDYRQGSGRGIITEYLINRHQEATNYRQTIQSYIEKIDATSQAFSSDLPVREQFYLANTVWIEFPANVVNNLTQLNYSPPAPPDQINFTERPTTRQQAFMLVINDLLIMDNLALFALLLAIAIDAVVILIALAGSYAFDDDEQVFNKARRDATERIKSILSGNEKDFAGVLRKNIEQFEQASEYGIQLHKMLENYENKKKKFSMTITHPKEKDKEIKKRFRLSNIVKHQNVEITEAPEKDNDKPQRKKIVI
ncbi:MAG: hypothetical protein V3V99_10945 [candidate division Zixibacteria bacterium]